MLVHRTVQFDRMERLTLREAAVSMGVAFQPDPEKEERHFPPRIVKSCAGGEQVNTDRADAAIKGLREAADACEEQAHPEWWERNAFVKVPAGVADTAQEAAKTLPLVADPPQFCIDMAANRRSQAVKLREALTLMVEARALIGAVPVDDS